ncbi:MAG: coproporphyrinogen III oxidase, partial [Flavobacteriales bacterium]|nr:coproporphyrinogen III oxidase [Flavobacteriales bacterium]
RQIILDIICHFEAAWTPKFESTSRFNEIKNELESLIEDDLCVLHAGGIKVTERGEAFVRNICMCFDAHLKQDQVKRFSKTI